MALTHELLASRWSPSVFDGGGIGTYAEYALGQAVAHLTVQARAMDLHTHQFAGFDHDLVAIRAGVPESVKVVAGIAIGRHGDSGFAEDSLVEREARPRTRMPLGAFVFADRWGTHGEVLWRYWTAGARSHRGPRRGAGRLL